MGENKEQPFTYCVVNQNGAPRYFTPKTREAGEDPAHFSGVRKLNLIVGPNNSGKSQLLRMLGKTIGQGSGYGRDTSLLHEVQASSLARLFMRELASARRRGNGSHPLDSLEALMVPENLVGGEALLAAQKLLEFLASTPYAPYSHSERKEFDERGWDAGTPRSRHFARVYVPVVRTIRKSVVASLLSAELGMPIASGAMSGQGASALYCFTGESLSDDLRSRRLGKRADRELVDDFERFLSERYFQGERLDLIPNDSADGAIHFRVGDEAERAFHELGDGLQHVVAMTWPMFVHRDQDLVLLIEEPELCLHPGLQRAVMKSFLDAPLGATRTRTVFLATHSNHLIDAALETPDDVAVFHVSKREPKTRSKGAEYNPEFLLRHMPTDDPALLRDLGVRPSSLLLANAAIWVEGISDRIYLRTWLSLHKDDKRYLEDLHFTFVEYGGSNRVHYEFVKGEPDASAKPMRPDRITRNWTLVLDSDASDLSTEKGKRIAALKAEVAPNRLHVTVGREMENLISAAVLKAWMKTNWKGDTATPPAFSENDYKLEYLGTFLHAEGEKAWPTAKRTRSIKAASGTIDDKVRFATETCALMTTWDDLTEEAQELTDKLIAFIKDANHH